MGFHEIVLPDEPARFEGYAQELGAVQRERMAKTGVLGRALHLKQHIGAVGELAITASVAGAGLFAERGRTFPVYVRFSNGSARTQPDKRPDVRGFSLKVVGVPGKKLIAGLEDEQTQDFLFIDQSAIPFRDPEEFMTFQRAAKDGPLPLLPRLLSGFGLRRALQVIKRLIKLQPVSSYATHIFHTGAPIAFGDTAVKLALVPVPNATQAPVGETLGADLAARLCAGPLVWSLQAQRFIDDQATPIEDASIEWTGPFVELATLRLPRQDVASPRGEEISALVGQFSFDPWHSIEAHRPLGAIMRARAATYRVSSVGRNAAPEPTTVLPLA